jgi:hypothetical protein
MKQVEIFPFPEGAPLRLQSFGKKAGDATVDGKSPGLGELQGSHEGLMGHPLVSGGQKAFQERPGILHDRTELLEQVDERDHDRA